MVTASWPRVWRRSGMLPMGSLTEEAGKGRSHELEQNEGVVPGKVKETGPHRGGAVAFSDGGRCFGGRRQAGVGP
jgi:hypothetical protein